MNRRKKSSELTHQGKLYWASLFNKIPKDLFVPSPGTTEDPYSFGWRLEDQLINLRISFKAMLYATAEAVVALAAVVDYIRSARSAGAFKVTFDANSQEWVKALRLDQVTNSDYARPDRGWTNPLGCYAYPLRRIELASKEDAATRATGFVRAVRRLPDAVFGDDKDNLLSSVERVASEAFLNIFEHAYDPGAKKILYATATVTPPGHFENGEALPNQYTSSQELEWLYENRNSMILEIAIADAGYGISRTLWKNAKEKHRSFAVDWETNAPNAASRRAAHQHLCEYAFHHDSTRKRDEDFGTLASRLNWRGLHRCIKQTEYLSGSILLVSGQGRAGYVFVQNRIQPVFPAQAVHADFPGTLALLRFSTRRKGGHRGPVQRTGSPVRLRVGYLASEAELQKGLATEQITHTLVAEDNESNKRVPSREIASTLRRFSRSGSKAVFFYFPFKTFTSAEELISLLRSLPPNYVAVLLFAHIPAPVCAELRAYSGSDWSPANQGTPRLLLLWDPERQTLRWQVAGESPLSSSAQKLYADLEQFGQADLGSEGNSVHIFANELAGAYPDVLIWEERTKSLSFANAEATLTHDDYATILTVAFKEFVKQEKYVKDFVFSCKEGEAIRLPTGRLVTRFFSVLQMLRCAPVLVAALSQRLLHVLEKIGRPSELCLVADGPASYFVSNLLVRNWPEAPQTRILQQLPKELLGSTHVLFVDAIYRGVTIARLCEELQGIAGWSRLVIACVDMRTLSLPRPFNMNCTVHSLVKHLFDPRLWKSSDPPLLIHEVDSITHTPLDKACEFIKLTTTDRGQAFLDQHPGLFLSGFHRVGDGQIHTVSFDTRRLIQEHEDFLVTSLVDEIAALLAGLPKRRQDFVLFSRPESSIYKLIRKIAADLERNIGRVLSICVADLTVAPTTPKAFFPRAADNLLAELHDVASQTTFLPDHPTSEFIGIYIDDASITGRSLQDFLTKATNLPNRRPKALFGIVVVNRLSPREIRFLNVCQDLRSTRQSGTSRKASPIPFRLRSLFRLQVKMTDESEPGGAPYTIRKLFEHSEYFDERLKTYATAIEWRLGRVFHSEVTASNNKLVVLHPFYSRDTDPEFLSTRVVQLRHLLALNAQNEGVVSEVLNAITELAGQQDVGLLSILALEPQLLHDDPLSIEGWQSIRDLCLVCLGGSYTTAQKSDALGILYYRKNEFIQHLHEILRHVVSDDDLMDQVACFVLSLSRQVRSWRQDARKCFDGLGNSGNLRALDWLRTILDVPEKVETSYIVEDTSQARASIHALVSNTWPHVGLYEWRDFDRIAKELTEGSPIMDAEAVKLGYTCMDYAERVLLPGLAGMRFFASTLPNPNDANRMWEALLDGIRTVGELRGILRACSDGDKTCGVALQSTWIRLRQCTLKAASPVSFLGRIEDISEEPSVIEELLPRLFCAPLPLIRTLALRYVPDLSLSYDSGTFEDGMVIVPVARTFVNDFVRILLGNMQRHGAPSSRYCKVSFVDSSVGIIFNDRKNQTAVRGEGRGLPLLKEYARRGKFRFEPRDNGEEFGQTVVFPDALRISPDIQRT